MEKIYRVTLLACVALTSLAVGFQLGWSAKDPSISAVVTPPETSQEFIVSAGPVIVSGRKIFQVKWIEKDTTLEAIALRDDVFVGQRVGIGAFFYLGDTPHSKITTEEVMRRGKHLGYVIE